MKHGALQSEIARLEEAMQALDAAWDRTTDTWRDGNARSVEANFMGPLRELMSQAVPAVGRLSDVLQSGVRRAGDPDDRCEAL